MLVRTYATRAEADAAVTALAGSVYLHEHREGGVDGYTITNPGRAAARIRARGVFTERAIVRLRMSDGSPAVPVPAVVTPSSGTLATYVERRVVAGTDALAVPLTR